jgi:hydrogenase expression/formation protein HypD
VDCALFADVCTPADPRGPCMVSFEGTCRNRYLYREVGDG